MAGDWIKMRTDLYRDPKVCVMADLLMDEDSELSRYVNQHMQRNACVTRNVMRNVTVGALVSVWGVLRHRGKRINDDLSIAGCSLSIIDDIADIPGFGEAMNSVGWVIESSECIVFPRFFEEFNVDPAEENKKKNAERQRRYREKLKAESNANSNVTVASQSNAREEKRRDSKPIVLDVVNQKQKRETSLPENFSISDAVRKWAAENGHAQLEAHLASFIDTCKAKGYKYVDWDAAFRNAIKGNWAKLTAPTAAPRRLVL